MILDYGVSLLLPLVVIAALFQPNAMRLYAGICFAGVTVAHELFLRDETGLNYYLSAAACDMLIVFLTSTIIPTPKMVESLHNICLTSIMLNFAGWAMYMLYMPPTFYNTAYVFLYAWSVFVLFRREAKDNVGGFSLDSWLSCFRFDRYTNALRNFTSKVK